MALSRIGTAGFVWAVITVGVAVVLRRPGVLLTVLAVWVADLLAYALKLVVDRPRPRADPLVRLPTDPSFPSGHAATSFAAATMLSLIAPRLAPALYVLAAGIAFSRVYVGVHYPFDVLAGAALGTVVGALGFRALRTLERFPPRWRSAPRRG